MLGILLDAAIIAFFIFMFKKCAVKSQLKNAMESVSFIIYHRRQEILHDREDHLHHRKEILHHHEDNLQGIASHVDTAEKA